MLSVSRRLYLPALMLLAVALLVGCGSGSASGAATPGATPHASVTPQPPMPTTLQVIRFAPHQDQVASFEAQTEDAVKVQRLFATLQALPPFVLFPSCPNDSGGGYLLTFLEHGKSVAQAVIGAGGCPHVAMSNPYGCHMLAETTMDQIADALGVSPAQVGRMGKFYDTATPGGPLAPEDPGVPLLPATPCGASA